MINDLEQARLTALLAAVPTGSGSPLSDLVSPETLARAAETLHTAGFHDGEAVQDLLVSKNLSLAAWQERAEKAEAELLALRSDIAEQWGTVYEVSSTKDVFEAWESEAVARAVVDGSPTDTGLVARSVTSWSPRD